MKIILLIFCSSFFVHANDYRQMKKIYQERSVRFYQLAQDFLKNKIDANKLPLKALPSDELNQFTVEFLRASLDILRQSNILQIRLLMKRYDEIHEANAIPLFKITGQILNGGSPTNERGGFHRSTGEIFIDIEKTGSREWLFILLHEIFHSLDGELIDSWEYFNNSSQRIIVENILEKKKRSDLDLKYLHKWVFHGLNSQLFAEYRDWLFCFQVYKDGIANNLWAKIPFIELVLKNKKKSENLKEFVYRYLNERAQVNDMLLNTPILKKIIDEERDIFILFN